MILKSIEEIGKIRESALVVSKTLGMLASEQKLLFLIISVNLALKVITGFQIRYV